MPNFQQIANDLVKMAVTFWLALSTGLIFHSLSMPAPYLMGSLFGVWAIGSIITPIRPYLGVARWFHVPVIIGLSVLIGATFDTNLISQIQQWWKSLIVMMVTTLIVCWLGYYTLTRLRGYEKRLAFFCCLPGGQAEALALARQLLDKDYVVALFHLVRVTIVFVSTPMLLAIFQGSDAVVQSNQTLTEMPSIFALSLHDVLLFVIIATIGLAIALLLRLPLPYLLGPMSLSMIVHLMGWAHLPRIHEFVILAQLAIGGAIGARLAQVAVSEVLSYLKDAVINAVMILGLYMLATLLMAALGDTALLEIWLAFVPGGLYEVTLLALIFGFDVAFVAFHHTVRIIPLFFALSYFGKHLPDETAK